MDELTNKLNYMHENGMLNSAYYNELMNIGFEIDEHIGNLRQETEFLKTRLENSIELPCKIGDTIYFNENANNRHTAIIEEINIYKKQVQFVWYQYDYGECTEIWDSDIVTLDEMGVSWFLTKQEAEAKLKEIAGD